MRVRMLGSGAASGWPNPWCSCASCMAAAAQGVVRGHTAALIDDRLLIDAGPDALRSAVRLGVRLSDVDAVLLTHGHPDHAHPVGWDWRGWAQSPRPLLLAGPVSALPDSPDPTVTMRPLRPGDRFEAAGYSIVALPAEHPGGALLYSVTAADGSSLLYATDTGVLRPEAVELAAGFPHDLLLLELTGGKLPVHLDQATWPAQVARLRIAGALAATAQLVAIHLGHELPPPDELDRWLQAHGAVAARDGDVYDTARRGRRILVLGGQSSGKSAYAESLLAGPVTYVATAPDRPGDAEWAERIRVHVARRPKTWRTVGADQLLDVLPHGPVLVDDLGLWLTGVLDGHWDSPAARTHVDAALAQLLAAWASVTDRAVLVAPEVGSGVVPATTSGRLFADLLGRATTALAQASDEVVQVVAGQPRRLK